MVSIVTLHASLKKPFIDVAIYVYITKASLEDL